MCEHHRKILIALGSNDNSIWGDPRGTVQKAMKKVADLFTVHLQHSRLYRTPAFPAGIGPDFTNAAMSFETAEKPRVVLEKLHQIEAEAGRLRQTRWGQRTLDIDLIGVGDLVLPDAGQHAYWRNLTTQEQAKTTPTELILPHPRVQDRAFVLVPLGDIAPTWRHPVLGQTVVEMLAALPADQVAEVVPISP